eukprot:COSAG02_NODE_6011_length_3877_cov_4.773690_2_plen_82_part_00
MLENAGTIDDGNTEDEEVERSCLDMLLDNGARSDQAQHGQHGHEPEHGGGWCGSPRLGGGSHDLRSPTRSAARLPPTVSLR